MNSYSPCRQHENGHYETCKDCEIDALRGLLRQVANAELIPTGDDKWNAFWLPQDLWQQIAPLRNGDADASR